MAKYWRGVRRFNPPALDVPDHPVRQFTVRLAVMTKRPSRSMLTTSPSPARIFPIRDMFPQTVETHALPAIPDTL
jgi:hypothetical protein